jgi:hypothetical protein
MIMDDDPIESVYAYVERTYIRLQAGDLLIRCLEEESAKPISNLVEGLVLAGPNSINALREILAEAEHRKYQIQDDLHQLMNDLSRSLRSYGLRMDGEYRELAFLSLSPIGVLSVMRDQNLTDHEIQTACLRLLKDSRDLVVSLMSRLSLMEEIEAYLQDWLWGMAYQSVRSQADSASPITS